MIELKVNGNCRSVQKGVTILQACALSNIEIPRFCYHDKISIAGNCRMCLVEISKSVKPVASCSLPVMDKMEIFTNTILVKKAREAVLEFLLANHPLDCPICDQGGECDLQDQTVIFGSDRGRFYEYKRAVEDKNCGPLIKTVMTRCIHCTRCVRFTNEVAGINILGVTGRGSRMEIGTYIEASIRSEFSGNLIDLCPVGALTSKPYSFTSRPWDLRSIESIDILDSIGSNIRVDVRGSEIMRILPSRNNSLNEDWITDKIRFVYDSFKRQRLVSPMIRKENGILINCDWDMAFSYFTNNLLNGIENVSSLRRKFVPIIGRFIESEGMLFIKKISSIFNLNYVFHEDDIYGSLNSDFRSFYKFNLSLRDLENSDVIFLIGCNPRLEGPILNLRIRKLVNNNKTVVFSFGSSSSLTYYINNIGNNVLNLISVFEARSWISRRIFSSQSTSLILGDSVLYRKDKNSFLLAFKYLSKYFINIKSSFCVNVFHVSANKVSYGELNIFGRLRKSLKHFPYQLNNSIFYLIGVSNIPVSVLKDLNVKIVYQGHHGDELASKSDLVLPGCLFIEKNGLFLNFEGRIQKSKFIALPSDLVREDWKIISLIFDFISRKLSSLVFVKELLFSFGLIDLKFIEYNNRNVGDFVSLKLIRKNLISYSKFFEVDKVFFSENTISYFDPFIDLCHPKLFYNSLIISRFGNFYSMDLLSLNSKVLSLCKQENYNKYIFF